MVNSDKKNEERMKKADEILDRYLSPEDQDSIEPMIYDAMRVFIGFKNETAELQYLRSARIILRNELLTAYDYLARNGLLEGFKEFRG